MLNYPTSLPDWNKYKLPVIGSFDPDDRLVCTVIIPRVYSRLFFGLASLLQEVYVYPDNDAFTPEQLVDVYNNDVEVICMGICDLVLDCINSNQAVRDAIQDLVENNFPEAQNDESVFDNAIPVENVKDDLDCLWGASLELTKLLLQRTAALLDFLESAVNALSGLTDFLSTVGTVIPYARWLELGGLVANVAVAAARLWVDDLATEDSLACELFCRIRANGGVLDTSVFESWVDWVQSDTPPYLPGQTAFRITALSYPRQSLFGRYVLAYDDQCSNDWQSLCSCSNCVLITDFDQAFVDIVQGQLGLGGRVDTVLVGGTYFATVELDFGQSIEITSIEVVWNQTSGAQTSDLAAASLNPFSLIQVWDGTPTGVRTDTEAGLQRVTSALQLRLDQPGTGGYIQSLKIVYNGPVLFGGMFSCP